MAMPASAAVFAFLALFKGYHSWHDVVGDITYLFQAIVALWGIYCGIMIWTRVAQKRFLNEEQQTEFLDEVDKRLMYGDLAGVETMCADDQRALPQLMRIAIANRNLPMKDIQKLIQTRMQRDVVADFDYRLRWIGSVIKMAPMLGLFGTVVGMMGAFAKLASADHVEASKLAEDIALALITTAIGLTTAMPMMTMLTSVNQRLADFEQLMAMGLSRFLESFKRATAPVQNQPTARPAPREAVAGRF